MDSHDAELRVSDVERAEVGKVLERAVGEGMLSLDEYSDRIDIALAARTRGELRRVTADLPGMQLAPSADPGASAESLRGRMSTVARKGQWTVPPRLRLNTRMCDTTLDFTAADLPGSVVDIDIDDYCSSTEFIVPDGATADLNAVETVAGSATVKVPTSPQSRRLHLIVHGRVRLGSVTVRHPFGTSLRRMLR